MIKQPEALRLANRLDLYAAGDKHQRDTEEAAAELRRLYEANQELLKVLKESRKIIRALSLRNLVKDWDVRTTAAIAKGEAK
jgi:hypothetical protein